MDFKLQLPEKVNIIIETIQAAGFEAYAVGGCVRDSIMGRIPDDWDITTSAKPEQVKQLFKRTIDTGIQHGTVTIMMGKEGFEVTTYRIDGEYEDSRHPKEVIFTPSLIEDLKRRDFTINAMAYNEKTGLVDEFHGIEDIEKKVIRCVGNARERFTEDALRMMRAVRFSAQLGYEIEEETKAAIKELAPTLQKISAERIQVELTKLVVSPNPDFLRNAYEMGITEQILPEFDKCMKTEQKHPHHCYSVGEHILHSMLEVRADKVLRFAMLFHDIGKPEVETIDMDGTTHFRGHAAISEKIAKDVLRRLHFDNDTIFKVTRLAAAHEYRAETNAKCVRRAVVRVGEDIFPLLLEVQRADIMAQSQYMREEKLNWITDVEVIYNQILEEKNCLSLKNLAVTGRDLMVLGIAPGQKLGEVLHQLLDIVIEEPDKNDKTILLEEAAKIMANFS